MEFIFPEPISIQKPIAWNTAATRLAALSENQLTVLFETYLPYTHTHHVDMKVRVGAHLVLERGILLEKIKMAMFGAASADAIKVYVKSRNHPYCHEVYARVWRDVVPTLIDPVAMALSGKFLAYREMLPSASLDAELACTDLVIGKSDFAKLQMTKATSRAALATYGRKIIDQAVQKEPREKIRREDFLTGMRQEFPGASDREFLRVWGQIAPTELRKGGRRPGQR
jgi:hypothetical protein